MKKARITITHQLEKTKHVFLVQDPNRLTKKEKERIMIKINVEMLLLQGKLHQK